MLFNEGRFAEARENLERALPIVVASGFRYREAVVVSNLAAIVVQHGELAKGRRLISRGLELCIELDDQEGIATAYTILGEIDRRAGDFEAAEGDLGKVLESMPETGFDVVSSDALLGLALVASTQGRHDDALVYADRALFHARRAESPMAVARANVGLGYVHLAPTMPRMRASHCVPGWRRPSGSTSDTSWSRPKPPSPESRSCRAVSTRLGGRAGVCWRRSVVQSSSVPSSRRRSTCCAGRCSSTVATPGPASRRGRRVYLDSAAARIGDDELRDSFLRNVPVNVELAEGVAGP